MAKRRETVLITGASSGIGLELARLFAAQGSDLVLTARREDRLTALAAEIRTEAEVEVLVLAADLEMRDGPAALHAALAERGSAIDVLVNNAGFGARGAFLKLPLERQLAMVEVNVTALVRLTGLFLPQMAARGGGGVLNVASTAAFLPGPGMTVYYATKAFVLSFSEALSEEVRGTGVVVTCLAPGPTATEFVAVAGSRGSRLAKMKGATARSVAEAGIAAFRSGKALVIPGVGNRLGAFGSRHAPRAWVRKASAYLQK